LIAGKRRLCYHRLNPPSKTDGSLEASMLKYLAIAAMAGAVLMIIVPAAGAQSLPKGYKGKTTWGPATCVHVRLVRSRQTRYAGAPRCRRVPV
jgi:hypothetical protein